MTDRADTIRRRLAHRNGVTDPEGAAALDAPVAEVEQLRAERDARTADLLAAGKLIKRLETERDAYKKQWNDAVDELSCDVAESEARCEQAIDALREIAKIEDSFQAQSRYTGTVATCFHDCPAMARAALVSLGETE